METESILRMLMPWSCKSIHLTHIKPTLESRFELVRIRGIIHKLWLKLTERAPLWVWGCLYFQSGIVAWMSTGTLKNDAQALVSHTSHSRWTCPGNSDMKRGSQQFCWDSQASQPRRKPDIQKTWKTASLCTACPSCMPAFRCIRFIMHVQITWFIAVVYYQVQQGQQHVQNMLDLLHIHGTSVSAHNHLFSWDFLGGNTGTILKLLDSLWFCTCLQAERDFWDKVNAATLVYS